MGTTSSVYEGQCAECSECHHCHDGIDDACGYCGDGYPTMDTCDSCGGNGADGGCSSHSQCSGQNPFCYSGQCAPCSECHHCHDGIDNTCGPCGDGYPTIDDTCTGSSSPGLWNTEYTFSGQDVVIMVLVLLNLLTVLGVICSCLRSRGGGVARHRQKYQVVSMDKAMAADSESEMKQFKEEAI